MSEGPVYCPNDKAELKYEYDQRGFVCPTCGLLWHGKFPIRDERVDVLAGSRIPKSDVRVIVPPPAGAAPSEAEPTHAEIMVLQYTYRRLMGQAISEPTMLELIREWERLRAARHAPASDGSVTAEAPRNRYFAWTRQFTGDPLTHRAYVRDRHTGKCVEGCPHRHRSALDAENCAAEMLQHYPIKEAANG